MVSRSSSSSSRTGTTDKGPRSVSAPKASLRSRIPRESFSGDIVKRGVDSGEQILFASKVAESMNRYNITTPFGRRQRALTPVPHPIAMTPTYFQTVVRQCRLPCGIYGDSSAFNARPPSAPGLSAICRCITHRASDLLRFNVCNRDCFTVALLKVSHQILGAPARISIAFPSFSVPRSLLNDWNCPRWAPALLSRLHRHHRPRAPAPEKTFHKIRFQVSARGPQTLCLPTNAGTRLRVRPQTIDEVPSRKKRSHPTSATNTLNVRTRLKALEEISRNGFAFARTGRTLQVYAFERISDSRKGVKDTQPRAAERGRTMRSLPPSDTS